MKVKDPLKFFGLLKWLDDRPLMEVVEPYRQRIFTDTLYSFEGSKPKYNLVLAGRAKKNWKSADLILAALYRLLCWKSPLGNQCYILANDAGQAGDDLELAKKLIKANPILQQELKIAKTIIERKDAEGFLEILPAQDVAGAHGKTYLFAGFDEIHSYRDWALFEALALDPFRPDAMMWISSYASLLNYPGIPLYDLVQKGKEGSDPRMFFSWYSGDYCTDPEFAAKETPEDRANPSNLPKNYLIQQKKRLPIHRYRRLHLNLPGAPEGAYLSPRLIEEATGSHTVLQPVPGLTYFGFVDMSGGSSDDATLGIAHDEDGRIIVDGIWTQGMKPPFDPRRAVELFANILKTYGIFHVTGDRYAGNTFQSDFQAQGIGYSECTLSKSSLYEALEVELNSGRVTLPRNDKLMQQLMCLILKGGKIDHPAGEHDDLSNAAAGAIYLCKEQPVNIDFKEDTFIGMSAGEFMEDWCYAKGCNW